MRRETTLAARNVPGAGGTLAPGFIEFDEHGERRVAESSTGAIRITRPDQALVMAPLAVSSTRSPTSTDARAEEGSRTGTTMRSGCTMRAMRRIGSTRSPTSTSTDSSTPSMGLVIRQRSTFRSAISRARVCAASWVSSSRLAMGIESDVHAPGRLWSGPG